VAGVKTLTMQQSLSESLSESDMSFILRGAVREEERGERDIRTEISEISGTLLL